MHVSVVDADRSRMSNRNRDLRNHFPQHVWARGNNRRRLFSYPRDYEHFLRILYAAATKRQISIWALALLSNHYHLIATPARGRDLSKFLKHVNQRWSWLRNRTKNCSGKLFEQSFGSKLIESDEQLQVTTLYVEANPVLAGIANTPGQYRYSSYAIHAGEPLRSKILRSVVTPSPWVVALSDSVAEQHIKYQQLMLEYLANRREPLHLDPKHRRSVVNPSENPPRRPNGDRAS